MPSPKRRTMKRDGNDAHKDGHALTPHGAELIVCSGIKSSSEPWGLRDTCGMQQSKSGSEQHSPAPLLLYVLQGIPLGLAGSIPLLSCRVRSISYKQQAIFSFVYWPFSVKLLWAPIVDSVFVSRIGRRKSWLIPSQYLIGLFMWWLFRTRYRFAW